jgi:hypothetical protein
MKILSIISVARNDNYERNFAYRFNHSLRSLADSARQLGCLEEIEWILCDWGSSPSIDALIDFRVPGVREILKIVDINSAILSALPSKSINSALAMNIDLRLAQGKCVLHLDTDAFFLTTQLRLLMDLARGRFRDYVPHAKTFFVIPRVEVPFTTTWQNLSYHEYQRLLLHRGAALYEAGSHLGLGSMQGLMTTKEVWDEFGGLSEGYNILGAIDADIVLRIGRYYPIVSTAGLGLRLYHQGHRDVDNAGLKEPFAEISQEPPPLEDNPNGQTWGQIQGFTLSARELLSVSQLSDCYPLARPSFSPLPHYVDFLKELILTLSLKTEASEFIKTILAEDFAADGLTDQSRVIVLYIIILALGKNFSSARVLLLTPRTSSVRLIMNRLAEGEAIWLFNPLPTPDAVIACPIVPKYTLTGKYPQMVKLQPLQGPAGPHLKSLPHLHPYPSTFDLCYLELGEGYRLTELLRQDLSERWSSRAVIIIDTTWGTQEGAELEALEQQLVGTHHHKKMKGFHIFYPQDEPNII